jgi:hypothetical protein
MAERSETGIRAIHIWLSSRNFLEFVYKDNTFNRDFIPGGGVWQDYSVPNEMRLQSGLDSKSPMQSGHISKYPMALGEPSET